MPAGSVRPRERSAEAAGGHDQLPRSADRVGPRHVSAVTWQVGALLAGVAVTIIPWRFPPAVMAAAVTVAAIGVGVVPFDTVGDALDVLGSPLAFLLVAVPLAVVLDDLGFFASAAAFVDGGRHLRLGLWVMAIGVTILFNLDAAVVLLTPLYVRLAVRHGEDPVALAFIPALVASLASSVLPVSNLTNLVLAQHLDLTARAFLVQAAPAALAASAVGWLGYRRTFASAAAVDPADDPVDCAALWRGGAVVAWLLVGFTVGEAFGLPAWAVAGSALAVVGFTTRRIRWRAVPLAPALLALALGTLAIAAAPALRIGRLLSIDGVAGEAAAFGAAVVGANLMNNLPATVVSLTPLSTHPDRVWAVLLGVNLGPLLWTTGALSTLLWQSTMTRLGHAVSGRRYATVGIRIAAPAMLTALAIRMLYQ